MAPVEKCRAVTDSGKQCQNPAESSGYCSKHLPKGQSLLEIVKMIGAIAQTATATIALIEAIVHICQQYAFYAGHSMPDDYRFLVSEFGNQSSSADRPSLYSSDTVNWSKARHLYESARRLEQTQSNSDQTNEQQLWNELQEFWDSLPSDMREDALNQLGQVNVRG